MLLRVMVLLTMFGSPPKSSLPQAVRDDRNSVLTGLVLFFVKTTTHDRLYADCIEEISGNEKSLDALRSIEPSEVRTPPAIEGELFERLILRSPVEVVGHRYLVVLDATTWILVPDRHHAILIWNRERFQQERIDRAEDATVGADTKRECDHSNQSKAGPLNQIAYRISNVAEEVYPYSAPGGTDFSLCSFQFQALRVKPTQTEVCATHSNRRATIGSTFVALRAGK